MGGQLSYNLAPGIGRVGQWADNGKRDSISKIANHAITIGCLVVRDADDKLAKHPASAADVLSALHGAGGIALQDFTLVSDPTTAVATIPYQKEFNAARRGRVLVLVEEAVTQGDQAFARFAASVNTPSLVQLGAMRKSADSSGAVAQVATFTPTAVDGKVYMVEVIDAAGHLLGVGEFTAGTSSTATTIVTGLKAALGTLAGITVSGTATLILTSSVAGVAFTAQSVGDGVLALAATTANVVGAATAAAAAGLYYSASGAAGTLVPVNCDMGGN